MTILETLDLVGVRNDLGEEVDLILGYRPRKKVKLELALSAFFLGDAFDSDAENAYFGAFKFRFKF